MTSAGEGVMRKLVIVLICLFALFTFLSAYSSDGQGSRSAYTSAGPYFPWQNLYFFPLPQGQGSLRPTLG